MTILQKLSDRDGFIYEVILLILKNVDSMNMERLQWELLKVGVYVKKPLLNEALATMREKNLIGKPEAKTKIVTPPTPKIIVP